MARFRKFWNRAPRNRLEAWIQDMRDRFNLPLIALCVVLFLGAQWVFGKFSGPERPARPMSARPSSIFGKPGPRVRSGKELADAVHGSLVGTASAAIPGMGDNVSVMVIFAEGMGRDMSFAQARSFDHLLENFPSLREKALQAMLERYQKARSALIKDLGDAPDAPTAEEILAHFPEVASVEALAPYLESATILISPKEEDDFAHIVIYAGDLSLAAVTIHGDRVVPESIGGFENIEDNLEALDTDEE